MHDLSRSSPVDLVIAESNDNRGAQEEVRLETNRAASAPLASLQGVHKRFGKVIALNGFDLEVRPGELLALLGPNGAGKSTAIALLLGLQSPDAGTARLFGQTPSARGARQHIGVMLQDITFPSDLRVRDLVDLVRSYYRAPYSLTEVMQLTRLTELADRLYGKLSGGQKRLTQFALAICGRPRLLFLDEPTTGLDVQARLLMWDTIRELVRMGCAIVLTTHYLEEAEAIADRIVVMAKGRVITCGTVEDMRALVSCAHITCVTTLSAEEVRTWPTVTAVATEATRLQVTTSHPETVTRRLLAADENLHGLAIRRAGLAEVFAGLAEGTES